MNRKLGVLLLVALLLAVGAGPALAAGPRPVRTTELPGIQYFTMVGFITDKGDDYIVVEVIHGNRFSKPYIGDDVSVMRRPDAELRRYTIVGCLLATWDQIAAGHTVSVQGYVVDGEFQATRITVDVPLTCCSS
jgi:hypothetical protein